MDNLTNWQKIIVGCLSGIAWAVAVYVEYTHPQLADACSEVRSTAHDILVGLGVYHLMQTPPKGQQ